MSRIFLVLILFSCNNLFYNKSKNLVNIAIKNDDIDLLKKMIKDDKRKDLIHLCIKQNSIKCLNYLVNNTKLSLKTYDQFNKLPIDYCSTIEMKEILIKAALKEEVLYNFYANDLDTMLFLLEKVDNIEDIKDDKGNSIFHLCVKEEKFELLNTLIELYPKNINILNKENESLMHLVLNLIEEDKNLYFLVKEFINKDVNILIKDSKKETALEMILRSKNLNLINIIVDRLDSIDKLKIVKKYIDIYDKELTELKGFRLIQQDYYYILGSFIEAKEDYLKEKEEAIKLIMLTMIMKRKDRNKYKILPTNTKLEDKNKFLFSGHDSINLDIWKGLIENDIISGQYYTIDKEDKKKAMDLAIDKISRINDQALGGKENFFKDSPETAKFAKAELQKLALLIHKYKNEMSKNKDDDKDGYIDKLRYSINLILDSAIDGCQAKFLQSIDQSIIYCLGTSIESNILSYIEIKILQFLEELLEKMIREYFPGITDTTHIRLYLKKQLRILPEDIKDINFNDIEMKKIIKDNKVELNEFKNDFNNRFNKDLLNNISSRDSEKSLKTMFEEYLDINIGAIFMNHLSEFVYNKGNLELEDETLIAMLYLKNYIIVKEEI